LVEDEPSAAKILAKGLREQTYAVDIAADGEVALEQAYLNDYDLVILDVMLPGKDGFEVCRQLRANGSIAGATESQEKTDFSLWEWNGDASQPALREVAKLDRKLKPEGVTRASVGDKDFTLIVSDTSRYLRLD